MLRRNHHPEIELTDAIGTLVVAAVTSQMKRLSRRRRALRKATSPAFGCRLRPGMQTPLWNELRAELRIRLKVYGRQALLARELGVPRQRINAFVTGGGRMPDAERTLQLLAWLARLRSADSRKVSPAG